MPLADMLDPADWSVLRPLVQFVAGVEPGLGTVLPILTVLTGLALVVYLSILGGRNLRDWWDWRRQSRINRLLARFARIRERIAGRGRDRRLELAGERQRRNLEELAEVVRGQLQAVRYALPPRLYKRTLGSVGRAVLDGDFDRLHGLHILLEHTGGNRLAARLEALLRPAR
jgi:hypothetical protein